MSWEGGNGLPNIDLGVVGWLGDTHWGHSDLKRAIGFGGVLCATIWKELITAACG